MTKRINFIRNESRFTLRGRLGRIIKLLSDEPIEDKYESEDRVGFADSTARDALVEAWLAANDLQMALEDLDEKKRNARVCGHGETISVYDIMNAESLIFSALCRIGRIGDEGEI